MSRASERNRGLRKTSIINSSRARSFQTSANRVISESGCNWRSERARHHAPTVSVLCSIIELIEVRPRAHQ